MAFTNKQREKEYLHQYYLENREKLKARARQWKEANYVPHPIIKLSDEELKRRRDERSRKWQAANPEKVRASNRKANAKRYKLHPEKWRAWDRVRKATKKGQLSRSPVCLSCGKQCKTEAHHHNGYETALAVIWLCTECHRSLHVF